MDPFQSKIPLLKSQPFQFPLAQGKKYTGIPSFSLPVASASKKSAVNLFYESLASAPPVPSRNQESGINPCALRPSGSCATEMYIREEKNKRREATEARNVAYGENYSISSEIIPTILEKLQGCPKDSLSLRIFRQHTDMGLCWHDSFFMMFFENEKTKPLALQLVGDFLTILMEKGYVGLKYETTKTTLIARTLKDKYKSTLKLSIWEHIVLALQRYALLGFLFVKEPQIPVAPIIKSSLGNRRPSLGETDFDRIHEYLKLGTMSCWEGGASMTGINRFMMDMTEFVREQTKDELKLESARTNLMQPTKTIGYYFTIQANADYQQEWDIIGSAHIISLFLCDSIWFLYDNETGILPLSTENTEQITEKGITSMQMYRTSTEFIYKLTLGDLSILTERMPHTSGFGTETESEYYALTLLNASYRLVINSPSSGNKGAGSGSAGGRRKTRRTKKNKSRKTH